MWPNSRISVMGGEQAASTLWTVRQQARGEDAESDTPAAQAFKTPIREQFETEGSPYYSSARLWDDGILDPVESRAALGLALAATAGAPIPETRTGVYRM
jgi:3-methylcrotonyl-CoA carboxylase beta subunit